MKSVNNRLISTLVTTKNCLNTWRQVSLMPLRPSKIPASLIGSYGKKRNHSGCFRFTLNACSSITSKMVESKQTSSYMMSSPSFSQEEDKLQGPHHLWEGTNQLHLIQKC